MNKHNDPGFAQEMTITGTVKDAVSRAAIQNVNIFVLNSSLGTASNARGEFVLSGSFTDQDTLAFSHIGYKLRKLPVASLREKNLVLLEPKPVELRNVEIEAIKDSPMTKEIPATISVLSIESVLAQASTDLGDLIRMKCWLSTMASV
jgi:outer membrane receptor for ferrienterochelin and colicins